MLYCATMDYKAFMWHDFTQLGNWSIIEGLTQVKQHQSGLQGLYVA